MRIAPLLGRAAAVAVVTSAVAMMASCQTTVSPVIGAPELDTPPREDGEETTNQGPEPVYVPEGGPWLDGAPPSDAKPDAPVEKASCSQIEPVLCNYDGTCPPISGILIGPPSGAPKTTADAGLDASAAFEARVGDGGGAAAFSIPFRDYAKYPEPHPPRSIAHCHVTCEANLRVVEGASATFTIVAGKEEGAYRLDVVNGSFVHTTSDGSITATHSTPVTSDWVHITVRLTPPAGTSPGKSEITLEAGATSSTTAVPITAVGEVMYFGVVPTTPHSVLVYVDDVYCRLSD